MDAQIFGYSRVSSEEQAQHGISIEAQRNILEGYAAMHTSTIRIFEDAGFSGKNTQRPGLQQLLAACRSGSVSAVVVWKLDRLSRSLRDTLTIIEDVFQPRNITLVSVTESIDTSTPSGRMMLNQDKHYQLDPDSAPVVRRVFEMYLSRSGYTSILEYLNSYTFPGTRKTPFGKSDLKNLLHNEIYSGTYVRRLGADPRHRITSPETIRVPGGVPALLTPDEWTRVCAIRDQSKTAAGIYRARLVYPLTGLVFCASCGSLMHLTIQESS